MGTGRGIFNRVAAWWAASVWRGLDFIYLHAAAGYRQQG
jgi:hypothetical protein